jgi:transcriptional regulator with XRE-family HTH domain
MYATFQDILSAQKLTVANVARGTGIKEGVFSNWKSRGGYLSLENTIKVAAFLNVSIDFLVLGKTANGSSVVMPPEERRIIDGFRAASAERKAIMMNLASDALELKKEKLSLSRKEG